jgi:hypothetical protein
VGTAAALEAVQPHIAGLGIPHLGPRTHVRSSSRGARSASHVGAGIPHLGPRTHVRSTSRGARSGATWEPAFRISVRGRTSGCAVHQSWRSTRSHVASPLCTASSVSRPHEEVVRSSAEPVGSTVPCSDTRRPSTSPRGLGIRVDRRGPRDV